FVKPKPCKWLRNLISAIPTHLLIDCIMCLYRHRTGHRQQSQAVAVQLTHLSEREPEKNQEKKYQCCGNREPKYAPLVVEQKPLKNSSHNDDHQPRRQCHWSFFRR